MSPSNEEVAAKQPEFAEGAAEAEVVHGLMLMSMNMRVHLSGRHRRAMKFQICWQLSNPTSSVLEKGSPRTLRLLRVCRMRGATSMTVSRVGSSSKPDRTKEAHVRLSTSESSQLEHAIPCGLCIVISLANRTFPTDFASLHWSTDLYDQNRGLLWGGVHRLPRTPSKAEPDPDQY